MHYKYVFVVLVYRNTEDIYECLKSISQKCNNYKVIIVNSYFDEESKSIFQEIANENNSDFISVPNKGYGFGNNRGIEYAILNYSFDYIIISNPDILIRRFDESIFNEQVKYDVIAPIIRNVNGKNQNPYWVTENKFAERLIYEGQKRKNNIILYSGYLINKLIRIYTLKRFFKSRNNDAVIFAAHGSFCVFSSKVIMTLKILYDENIFLFAEEAYLAHILKENNFCIGFSKAIEIFHKEDGSMKLSEINEYDEERKSVLHYYERYVLNRRFRGGGC